ncbi:hypothetical protein, partial [Teichococcus cervicalis]
MAPAIGSDMAGLLRPAGQGEGARPAAAPAAGAEGFAQLLQGVLILPDPATLPVLPQGSAP